MKNNIFTKIFFVFIFLTIAHCLAQSNDKNNILLKKAESKNITSIKGTERLNQLISKETTKNLEYVYVPTNIQRQNEFYIYVDDDGKLITKQEDNRKKYRVVKDTVMVVSKGYFSWSGKIIGEKVVGSVRLVQNFYDGTVSGTIEIFDNLYQINPLDEEIHALYQFDKTKVKKKRNNINDVFAANQDTINVGSVISSNNNQLQKTTSGCTYTLDVAVFYTPQAATGRDENSIINTAISEISACFTNSQINVAVNKVYSGELSITFIGNLNADFNSFQNNQNVISILNSTHADLAVLLMDYNGGQWANVAGYSAAYLADQNNRHSIMKVDEAVSFYKTFAHELGHLFGAQHHPNDDFLDPDAPSWARAHRFSVYDGQWTLRKATIMAETWDGMDMYTPILYFSNPNVTWSEGYLSALTGTSSRNNAARVSSTAPVITSLGSGLNVTINGSVNPYSGYGSLTSTVCGGSGDYSYRWLWSNPPWSSPILVGTGSSLSMNFGWGDNLITLEVTAGSGQTGEASRYYYVVYSYPKILSENENPKEINNKRSEIINIHPNPFNPITNVTIKLSEHKYVELNVYDMLGSVIDKLYKGILREGTHDFKFNGQSFSSGTYIIQLITDNEIISKKMLLMK